MGVIFVPEELSLSPIGNSYSIIVLKMSLCWVILLLKPWIMFETLWQLWRRKAFLYH